MNWERKSGHGKVDADLGDSKTKEFPGLSDWHQQLT